MSAFGTYGVSMSARTRVASSKPETFTLDAATYDRSGRLHRDGFVLDTQGVAPDHRFDFHLDTHGFGGIPDLTEEGSKPTWQLELGPRF